MTTREEYAEAATTCEFNAQTERDCGETESAKEFELAARVLRALADGAVLVPADQASEPEKQRCRSKKHGEYDRLRCCLPYGHAGECSFVVDARKLT